MKTKTSTTINVAALLMGAKVSSARFWFTLIGGTLLNAFMAIQTILDEHVELQILSIIAAVMFNTIMPLLNFFNGQEKQVDEKNS